MERQGITDVTRKWIMSADLVVENEKGEGLIFHSDKVTPVTKEVIDHYFGHLPCQDVFLTKKPSTAP
jgi:hypothetical protein